MSILVDYGINILAILLLLTLYFIITVRSEVKSFSLMMIKSMIVLNLIIIVLEIISWVVDYQTGDLNYILAVSSNFLISILGAVLACLWLNYVDYKVFSNIDRLKRKWFYAQPIILMFVLLFVNLFAPFLYSIDPETNIFYFLPYIYILHGIIYAMLFYAIYFVFKHRYEANPILMRVVVLLFLFPLVGSILQIFEEEVFLTWTTLSIAILMAYVLLETNTGNTDYLTGLFSRQYFELYTRTLIEKNEPFGLLMIDLDGFKDINDQHGHYQGDLALIEFSKLLKHACKDVYAISRLAGDEFMIITKPNYPYEDVILQLENKVLKHPNNIINQIQFSFGYQEKEKDMTLDQLYISADKKMYTHKERN
jgi:diguanylate cyclase (GGDEF)-like protein